MMTIRYKYRHAQTGKLGWFQCDRDDFLALWNNASFRAGLCWCVIDMGGGRYRIWSDAVNRWYDSPKRYWF